MLYKHIYLVYFLLMTANWLCSNKPSDDGNYFAPMLIWLYCCLVCVCAIVAMLAQ